MSGSRNFYQRGSNFDNVFFSVVVVVFLVDKGRKNPDTTISRPSTARQRNAIEMAFRWRADDGQTLNAGLVSL